MTSPIRLALAAILLAAPALAQAPRVQMPQTLGTITQGALSAQPFACFDLAIASVSVSQSVATVIVTRPGAGAPNVHRPAALIAEATAPGYVMQTTSFSVTQTDAGFQFGVPPAQGSLRVMLRAPNDCNPSNNERVLSFDAS